MKQKYLDSLMKQSLKILDLFQQASSQTKFFEFCKVSIHVLCALTCAKTIKFHIPGETNVSESLRKKAFDCGIMSILTYINSQIPKKADKQS